VASIESNSKKVGNTIVKGFFSTVRSEISQQIMELHNRVDATLLHLRQLSERCTNKQRQMEVDYNRISSRYVSIFSDLNKELENRIYEIDRPVFEFKAQSDGRVGRILQSDDVTTVAVSGSETSHVGAQISTSITKRRACEALEKAHSFLTKQEKTDDVLQHSLLDDGRSLTYYTPVCLVETRSESGKIDRRAYPNNMFREGEVSDKINSQTWNNASRDNAENITHSFTAEVAARYGINADSHANRVKDCIMRLFDIHTIQTL